MALDRNGIIEKGERVSTPRFLMVTIKEILSEPAARLGGYYEPTHFNHPEYEILGKHTGENTMEFVAVVRNTSHPGIFVSLLHEINAAQTPATLCACADLVHNHREDGLLNGPQAVMLHLHIDEERKIRWPVINSRIICDPGADPDDRSNRRHYVLLQFDMGIDGKPIRMFDAQRFYSRPDDLFRLLEIAPANVGGEEFGILVRMHMESGIIKEWDAASLYINSFPVFDPPKFADTTCEMEESCQ